MTQKITKTQRQKYLKIASEILDIIGLSHFNVDFAWADSNRQIDANGDTPLAEIIINSCYLDATVTVFPIFWHKDEELRIHTIAHELSHIVTEPMYVAARSNASPAEFPWIEGAREEMTERVSRIVLKAYNK